MINWVLHFFAGNQAKFGTSKTNYISIKIVDLYLLLTQKKMITPETIVPVRRVLPHPLLTGLLALVLFASCRSLQAPEFRNVDNLRLEKLGLSESTLLANVRCYNPNNTRLNLKQASGEAWLDGTHLGNFTVDAWVPIPARGEFTLPVSLRTDLSRILKNSLSALLQKDVTIKIEGKAKVGKAGIYVNYPFSYEGKQELEKLLR